MLSRSCLLSTRRGSAKIILVAVLAVVIAAALIFTTLNITATDSPSSSDRRGTQMVQLKCEKCGHQFSLSVRDLAGQGRDRERPVELANGAPKADCPSCKQQSCAVVVQMRRPGADRLVPPEQAAPQVPAPK